MHAVTQHPLASQQYLVVSPALVPDEFVRTAAHVRVGNVVAIRQTQRQRQRTGSVAVVALVAAPVVVGNGALLALALSDNARSTASVVGQGRGNRGHSLILC